MTMQKTCLVLGGHGFIGSHIVDSLLASGWNVRVFGRQPRPLAPPYPVMWDQNVEFVQGEFGNQGDIEVALEGCSLCIHCITTTTPQSSNEDMRHDVESNLVGTLRLLKLIKSSDVKKTVFLSSGGTIYGLPNYTPIDECHPTAPTSSYGITKLAIEKYFDLHERLWDLRSVVLRVSNPYGERQRIESRQGAVGVFLGRALQGKPLSIWGDGMVVRDYVYVGDVAEAVMASIAYEGEERVFNIGAGTGHSLVDIIDVIKRVAQPDLVVNFEPGRAFDVPVSILDVSRAARELAWVPMMSLEDGIAKTALWMRKVLARAA